MLFDTSLRRELSRSFAATLLIVLTVVLTAIALKVQGDPASTAGGHAALDRPKDRP